MVNPSLMLRVVVINSHLYAKNNKATEGTSDPGDQYAWLQSVLTAARSKKEKVLLIYVCVHILCDKMRSMGLLVSDDGRWYVK
jgi:hypothetical protein